MTKFKTKLSIEKKFNKSVQAAQKHSNRLAEDLQAALNEVINADSVDNIVRERLVDMVDEVLRFGVTIWIGDIGISKLKIQENRLIWESNGVKDSDHHFNSNITIRPVKASSSDPIQSFGLNR